jgi:hypothetical protein
VFALAVIWWAWVCYAWLTSVVEPDEGSVRLVMLTAMAGLLNALALLLLAVVPVATNVDALVTIAAVDVLLWA